MSKKKEKSSKTKKSLTNLILGIFSSSPNKIYNYKQLSALLNLKDSSQKQLVSEILYELKKTENLDEIERGKFKLKSKSGYVTGVIEITSQGVASLVSEDLKDNVLISTRNLHGALHGDTVKAFVFARNKSHLPEGEVITIVERSRSTFVGIIEISGHYAFFIPDQKRMPFDIYIPEDAINGAKNKQKVIVKIVDWPGRSKNPVGEVVEVLGDAGDHLAEMNAILAEFELPLSFPQKVLDEAQKLKNEIPESEIAKRKDFRNITTLTIDPDDAKDFDDALSYEKLEGNLHRIGVHIADVTHYVKEDTDLDNEAFVRGTSVYLVDRVVPMLPEHLSNFICSLRPNEDKLCFSAVFDLTEEGEVVSEWFGKTIINSDRRFTYQEAQDVIETGKGDLSEEIVTLNNLAIKLRAQRFRNGAIGFERNEVKFKLDENFKPIDIIQKIPKESNHLIEEFMLLANKKVAEFVGKKSKGSEPKTFVYRVHDNPDPEKLRSFSDFIGNLGHKKINLASPKAMARDINELLENIKGKGDQGVIENLAIRAMAKAEYSTRNIGHYGLAFKHYSHFTSPIRRYPDMMTHRLLEHYLTGGASADRKIFEKKCIHSSQMEQKATMAERASVKYKQVEYMKDNIGKIYSGIISGVTSWGIYVEIIENKCEGMISLKEMDDDFYYLDEENLQIIGRKYNRKLRVGEVVDVEVIRANIIKRHLDFRLADLD